MEDRKEQTFSTASQKEKINRVIHYNLLIYDPSRRFILRYVGLPGSSFNNSDLEFQSPHEFINENIIDFWTTYSIKISPYLDKFFHADTTLLT